MKPKVLVARATFPDILERLEAHFELDRNMDDVPLTPEQLRLCIADKTGAMLMGGERIDGALIEHAPHLRAVSNCAAGYNNFDLAAITRAGIIATNTPDISNESVADLAWGLLISAARRIPESDVHVRSGTWKGFAYNLFLGVDLHHSTLGIMGMGRIGQAIARRAAGFRMKVIYHNRTRLDADIEEACNASYVPRDELLHEADHVVLTLPYSVEAHHTIGAAELAAMKPTATLVNVARGGIVDDAALANALRQGKLAGAGLDVFENEPALHPSLFDAPNLVMSPHIGSATTAARRALANLAVDNLLAALDVGHDAGRPPNILNPEVLQKSRRA
ncbi:D-glycerate dehydrogenase [Burkholderia sp. Leaf177]|uniref:2-hydroxyacid dehydrogenase n=1 Tax=Burkholderia sp. Leaf177 TaxID=1736287 RepID=UPI000700D196|nr:D-glycerate dehydrogenase [Burkholderia sp. Leaf177]KQR77161.1 D-glycerate dehydrogenase [Burkholderia sp. Leaf177]